MHNGETSQEALDQVRDILRAKHYSYRTEEAYLDWICRYILICWNVRGSQVGSSELLSGGSKWASGEYVLRWLSACVGLGCPAEDPHLQRPADNNSAPRWPRLSSC